MKLSSPKESQFAKFDWIVLIILTYSVVKQTLFRYFVNTLARNSKVRTSLAQDSRSTESNFGQKNLHFNCTMGEQRLYVEATLCIGPSFIYS